MWMPLGIKIDGKRKKNITGTNGLELKKKKKKKKNHCDQEANNH